MNLEQDLGLEVLVPMALANTPSDRFGTQIPKIVTGFMAVAQLVVQRTRR